MRGFTRLIAFLTLLTPLVSHASPPETSSLTASSLRIEQTETGAILTLEGPVEAVLRGDRMSADSAVVVVRSGAEALDNAVVSIELRGRVRYQGADGSRGEAATAFLDNVRRRLTLRGGISFGKGGARVSASRLEYDIENREVLLTGNVLLTESALTARCDSATYSLTEQNGILTGSVEVEFSGVEMTFAGKTIGQVVLTGPQLAVSAEAGETRTTSEGGRATVRAGEYSFSADTLAFTASEQGGVSFFSGTGDTRLSGPEGSLSAERASYSSADGIFRADGSVVFSILGQEGTAESVELNLASGWTVRMLGGRLEGPLE